jgi:acyl dehydratase
MLDKSDIGKVFPVVTAEVEKGRLRFFAKAIGETEAIYLDQQAAINAGYADLPVPPTFFFSLKMDVADPFLNYINLGAPLEKILHAKQAFAYHKMAVAGDTLTFKSHVVDIYDKKGGALEFLIEQTKVTDQHGEHVADMITTLVIRN